MLIIVWFKTSFCGISDILGGQGVEQYTAAQMVTNVKEKLNLKQVLP